MANQKDLEKIELKSPGTAQDAPCERACAHKGDIEKEIDELMEIVWELTEQGALTETHYKGSDKGRIVRDSLPLLCRRNLVVIQDGHIRFTPEGEVRARNIIRRHRLTERMLTDLFDIPEGRIEGPSCEFEHILSEEVTDSICTFLGHPAQCPHGKPIPRGECCSKVMRYVRPLVMPLSDLMPGEKGMIKFISSKDKRRLQKLSSLGIIPGATVIVHQKLPDMVIQVSETDIALDRDFVCDIYVKRMNGH